ncbi:MAG: glycosyltransferase [Balneolaceae bacterium]|nr:MAG: glycosyltransferase [Balneolaceae bacterium]
MDKLPQLSIITVFRNQKDEAENILTALYEMKGLDFELIIYDDASHDGTVQTIESLIEYFNHDHTFFFTNEQPEGRGPSLNKAMAAAGGQYLWIVDILADITKPIVRQGIERLRTSSKIYSYLGKNNTPEDHAAALDAVTTGKLPCDSVFIFNRKFLPQKDQFLNPFLNHYHAFDLCIRGGINSFSGTDDVADGLLFSRENPPSKGDCRELIFSIQRAANPANEALNRSIIEALGRMTLTAADDKPDLNSLLAEARYFRREGKSGNALEMLNRIMELYPDNREARRIKVDILESQRRYVEAAELKHGLKKYPVPGITTESNVLPAEKTAFETEGNEDEVKSEIEDEIKDVVEDLVEDLVEDEFEDVVEDEFEGEDLTGSAAGADADEEAAEETEIVPGRQTGRKPVADAETETELEADTQAETEAHTEAESESEAESEADTLAEASATANSDEDEDEDAGEYTKAHSHSDSDSALETEPDLEAEVADAEISPEPGGIRVSIVIPTAVHRKPLLEECLAALSIYTDASSTELIIVDNASLDDTYDYLDQLEQDGFMNIRVISNRINRGFAAAANQGIQAASGKFICVMHNDVVVASDVTGKLAVLMEKNPEYGLIGPVSNRCMNPAQIRGGTRHEETLAEATLIDSFCMMFRADASPEFDEQYGLAFAEDADICYQLRSKGWKTGIAGHIYAEHYMGATTLEIGLDTNGPEYWINAAIFNQKWGLKTELPDFGDSDEIDQLAMLGNLMNTYRPEEDLLAYAEGLLTRETRTKIMEAKHDRERLTSLIRALIVLDQRDILRYLEEKMDHYEPDAELALRLIHYYYDRNIYSRCLKYIDACGSNLPITEKYFRLKIAVGEKDSDKAVDLLNQLMNEAPVHPGIYKLAGDIHMLENNHKESEEFYSLAYQIDPIRFGKSGKTEIAYSDSVI